MVPILAGVPWDATTLGRPGARLAPAAVREELRSRLHAFDATNGTTVEWEDAGDARVGATHEEMLEGVNALLAARWKPGATPPIGFLGGDHAVAYAGVRAVRRFFPELTVINLDAHLDLRPIDAGPSNGNWALRMIEDLERPLVEIGCGRFSNEERSFETARRAHVRVVSARELHQQGVATAVRALDDAIGAGGDVYLSIDIDVVEQAEAPGASAPTVDGIGVHELFELLDWATRRFHVRAFDICEVNPTVDPTGRTARLAGYAALQLLAPRPPSAPALSAPT